MNPLNEFQRLEDFYRKGGDIDDMPENLRRMEVIFRFSAPFVENGYTSPKDLGIKIFARFGAEFDISKKTAYNYALNAFGYYEESVSTTNTPQIVKARLTKTLWKLIDFHYTHTLPINPEKGQKAIDMAMGRIIEINPEVKLPSGETEKNTGETFMVLSSDASRFADLHQIPESHVFALVEQFTKDFDLTPEQRDTIIMRDVKGALLYEK